MRTNDWGAATNGAQMRISLSGNQRDIMTNQPFRLSIEVRNISSNKTFCVYKASPMEKDPRWSFMVLAPSGKDVSPTPLKVYGGDGTTISINPNQEEEFEFDLRKLCTFDETGTYRVRAKRVIWPLDGRKPFAVESQVLHLSVIPGKWEGVDPWTTNQLKHW